MATVIPSDSNPPPLGDFPEEGSLKMPSVPDDSFYEVVDGQIVELPPMSVYECGIASLLALALLQTVKIQKLGRVVVETLFWLDRAGKLKRRPDLAFVSAEKWPLSKTAPRTEAWDVIPDLAIEVVSQSNKADEIAVKLRDYFRAGVRQVWVIYPVTRQVYVYTSLTSVQILIEPAELEGGDLIPEFHLSLTELFEDGPGDEEPEATPA
jgi:Uma2 family endonuclease